MEKKELSTPVFSVFSWLHRSVIDSKSFGGEISEGQYLKEPEDADKCALAPVSPHYDC